MLLLLIPYFGQSQQNKFCLCTRDKTGIIREKISTQLYDTNGNTIQSDSNNCFKNILIGKSYILKITSKEHYDFQKVVSIEKSTQIDTVFLDKIQHIVKFQYFLKSNRLSITNKKRLDSLFKVYRQQYIQKITLTINIKTHTPHDFTEAVTQIVNLIFRNTHYIKKPIFFEVIFEKNELEPMYYYIELYL
jgi:hypothetical protein